MKTTRTTVSAALLAASLLTAPAFADENERVEALKGAMPGVWTQDYAAATNAAAADGKPVLLDFTGSDWCGWCMLMEEKVFSQQEWKDWAEGKIYLVKLDFPMNDELVPEEYRARNRALQKEYGIGGYPTYVVLDSAFKRLGQLGASRNAKPAKFIADLAKLTGLPYEAPPAPAANPAVARAVTAFVAANKAEEAESEKLDNPTGADLVRLLVQYSDALAAVDLTEVPDAFRDAFKAHQGAFAALTEETKKLPADKPLDDLGEPPAGFVEAMMKLQGTVEALADAADACGCDGDAIRDAF